LLLIANNYRLKGAEIFVRILSALKDRGNGAVRGLVVGAGGEGVYERLAEKIGVADRVVFHEAAVDIERFYAAADIYLHPTFYDPMSLVALEALASGLPVVTTRFNGCSEIMTQGTEGFWTDEPRDVPAFLSYVETLLDSSRRDEAGRAARELALKYPLERNFREIVAVYDKALAEDTMANVEIRKEQD
jgi:UDP-glucose:(heptosyl)LPS alpha-1,3-glucosyltransferase